MASPRRRATRDRIVRYYRFTVVAGVLTIFFCTVSVIFFSLELYRLDEFFINHQWALRKQGNPTFYDKNYLEVSRERMVYLLQVVRIEKAVLAAALCTIITLVVAAGALIKAAIKRRPRVFIFWAGSLSVSFLVGLAYTLMDCVIYGFTSRTNGMLLTWLGFGIIFGHCLRSVYRYAQMIKTSQLSRTQRHHRHHHHHVDSGVAMFDASLWSADIFTIAGSSSDHVTPPSHPAAIMMQPPCYEDAIQDDACKPPDIDEKPPDYEP